MPEAPEALFTCESWQKLPLHGRKIELPSTLKTKNLSLKILLMIGPKKSSNLHGFGAQVVAQPRMGSWPLTSSVSWRSEVKATFLGGLR